jgi:hypothetical protein
MKKKELTVVANLTIKVMIYCVLRSVNVKCFICNNKQVICTINHHELSKTMTEEGTDYNVNITKTHLMTDMRLVSR